MAEKKNTLVGWELNWDQDHLSKFASSLVLDYKSIIENQILVSKQLPKTHWTPQLSHSIISEWFTYKRVVRSKVEEEKKLLNWCFGWKIITFNIYSCYCWKDKLTLNNVLLNLLRRKLAFAPMRFLFFLPLNEMGKQNRRQDATGIGRISMRTSFVPKMHLQKR